MALAAFAVDRLTGSGLSTVHSGVDQNTLVFSPVDDNVRPYELGSYPMSVPQVEGEYNWSMPTVFRFRTISLPNNQVSDLRLIGPVAAPGGGLAVFLGTTNDSFTPTLGSSVYATGLQHYHGAGAGFYDFDSAYLVVPVSGNSVITSTGTLNQYTSLIVAQLQVGADASSQVGNMSTYTLRLRYIET